jgi:hypothetical protein
MANNKVYANFLMHGRTKGSRNGISTTKGYTAVGQRATGKLVNGRYIYDTPKYSAGNSSKATTGGTVKKSSEKPANVSQEYWDNLQANTNPNYTPSKPKPKSGINTSIDPRYAKRSTQHGTPWVSEEYKQELAYNTGKSYTPKKSAINVNTDPRYKKQETNTGLKGDPRYSVAGTNKIDRAKIEALSKKGAANNWQQQAELERWKKQNQNNIAAKKKAQRAYDSAAKGAANNWQQQAAAARDNKETYTKYKEGKVSAITAKDNSGDVTTMYHPKEPYGVNYTAIKTEKLGAASKGKKNNWQQAGNLTRSMTEVARDLRNREEAKAKAKEAARSASYNKMSSTQKNAMKGDPRYTSNKPGPLFTSRDPKYGYSGKNDPRAPVFKEITMIDMYGNKTGGKETPMNRDPYFESWAKATNKQESAKAQAGNKAFMNAFEESKKRNSRSDIGNAVADFKEEAKAKAKSLFKKKKKK